MAGPKRELRAEQTVQVRILHHLRRSYSAIDAELRQLERKVGPGAALRRSQMRAAQTVMRREIAELWKLVGSEVEAGRALAAAAAGDDLAEAADIFKLAGLTKTEIQILKAGMREAATLNVDAALRRAMGDSYVPLSERVWKSEVLVRGQLDRIIFDHLSRGSSARELAKAVRQFALPSARGGMRYAAARLARTEINNAHHAVMKREIEDEPFVEYAKWHLSGSHKVPDQCNDYAQTDHIGEGPGVYKKNAVPNRPHPNCFCYVTAITVDRDEFVKSFQEGKYDDWLRSHGVDPGEAPVSSATATATATATAAHVRRTALRQSLDQWSDAEIQELLRMSPSYGGAAGTHDPVLHAILEKQGFTGFPGQTSSPEGAILFRGFAGKDASAYAKQYSSGDMFVGQGMWGNGVYTTSIEKYAWMYAEDDGVVSKMELMPGARTIDAKELKKMLSDMALDPKFAVSPMRKLLKDPGKAAALMGYDAIDVMGGKEMVILNRTATRMVTS